MRERERDTRIFVTSCPEFHSFIHKIRYPYHGTSLPYFDFEGGGAFVCMFQVIIITIINNNNFSLCGLLQAKSLLLLLRLTSKAKFGYTKTNTTTARYVIWEGIFFRRKKKENRKHSAAISATQTCPFLHEFSGICQKKEKKSQRGKKRKEYLMGEKK